jgi:uncharacterized protein DUF6884/GIY-YIG catalytic domain-containing protein
MSLLMGPKYQALCALLDVAAQRGDQIAEFSFTEIDAMVGGLPMSARTHRPWWANGGHSQSQAWRSVGWRVESVDLGLEMVRFTRESSKGGHAHQEPAINEASPHVTSTQLGSATSSSSLPAKPSVLLIGCVKTKLSTPAPAKDLYTSPLFARRRGYADRSRTPWFVLSSQWGLIDPAQIVAPYDMYLADQPTSYRRAWGAFVVEQLRLRHPLTAGSTVEIHAGGAYVAAVQDPLESLGVVVTNPVDATTLGHILQWYDHAGHALALNHAVAHLTLEAVAALSSEDHALTSAALRRDDGDALELPGLYAWWVDAEGAASLSDGLGVAIEPGLIYVGEAGATRWPSGRDSKNTLKARLNGILENSVGSSTFRKSLDAILRRPLGLNAVDETRLGAWMNAHLQVTTWATSEADVLEQVASRVLQALDPPLNLKGMTATHLRTRLSQLRKEAAG